MRAYHLAALLALGFWQVAPAPVVPPRAGLLRLGLAYATGEWEEASFDCDGNWTGSVGVPARSAGARLDYLAADGAVRVTAVGGRWWSARNPGYYMAATRNTFAGAQIAVEEPGIGIGAGVVSRPFETDATSVPSFYLRLGRNDRQHFQAEVFPLTETPTMMGTVRIGVGFGQGPTPRRSVNGFVGLAWGPYTDQLGQGVVLVDVAIPVAHSVELLIRGNAGPGAGRRQWAAGGGLRMVW